LKAPAEWNAESYHVVSRPHETWGARVLDRVDPAGISVALDVGCGTGKITAELLERLPDATVYALDRSASMLEVAERELRPRYGDRVRFVQVDLARIEPKHVDEPADLIFSTATFHWVADHDDLFRRLYAMLAPGGKLIAQCGGGPNIERLLGRVRELMAREPFAPHFAGWLGPWNFADAESTAARLEAAGFTEIETSLEYHPAIMADAEEFRTFLTTVILGEHLHRLPTDELKISFVAKLTEQAATDDPPFELDYWRLNLMGARPNGSAG
jgi:trans-aconitate 2-methyltransferase